MEITIAMIISILGAIISVSNFVLNRKDKSNTDTGKESYEKGVLTEKIDNLTKQVDKILDRLDSYDVEINQRIEKAILVHERQYHNNSK